MTVLELLVAVSVGAILLSVAVPSFTAFVRNAQQASAANELLAGLHFARDLAITRNMRVVVCASSDGLACGADGWAAGWIAFVDVDDDRTRDAGEPVERVGEDLGDITVATAEFPSYLVYRPSGRVMVASVVENSGQFTLCDARGAGHARVVIVEVSGRPRVSRTQADGSAPVCA